MKLSFSTLGCPEWTLEQIAKTAGALKYDGVELRTDRWRVEPVEVHAVRSSFFDDPHRFPPGSTVLDCALLMRDIPATWSALEPMRVTRHTAPLDRPPERNTALAE